MSVTSSEWKHYVLLSHEPPRREHIAEAALSPQRRVHADVAVIKKENTKQAHAICADPGVRLKPARLAYK